ncbi:laminin EGF-like protein, partial [Cooperia oncophora]
LVPYDFAFSFRPIDQGAYTCEAINVKGRVLATPDCIVRIVNIPAPEPPRPQVRCDPHGAVSSYPDHTGTCPCKPLVTGPTCSECRPGSFHLHEKAPQGCLKCFCFGITDNCRSSSHYRTQVWTFLIPIWFCMFVLCSLSLPMDSL